MLTNLLDAAWDHGINFFDTANSYGGGDSERYIGEWLADYDREDVVIASKVYRRRRPSASGLDPEAVHGE